jgi:hypothetical protein
MRLEPLYRMVFRYPRGWSVGLDTDGSEGQHLFFAAFCPDFHGVISTDDGATVLFQCGGYGRPYPQDARQIVVWLTHLSEAAEHRWLNDVVCVGTGEVRPDELVIDVAEVVWEPLATPTG